MFSLYLTAALISVSAVSGDNNDYVVIVDSWWTYEGISGPEYWGVLNPEWTMCNKGRSQSPVNINPGMRSPFKLSWENANMLGEIKFSPES